MTIEDLAEQFKNGNFKRQHKSNITITEDGILLEDKIIKKGEVAKIINKDQVDAFKKKMEKENAMREYMKRNQGDFVNFMYEYMCPAFERLESREDCKGNKANIHIIRFIRLATHLNFNNNLYDDNNNRIKKGNLSKIWDTKNNRKSVTETFNILNSEGFIDVTKEGYIMINDSIIKKGEMKDFEKIKKQDYNKTYTRLFSDNITEMYLNTEPKARKQLANLFKILPYINFKYNVFCSNPIEGDEDKITPLTWSDLARICGYDEKKQIARFKKDLFNLTVNGYEAIGQFISKNGYTIVVNPKVYYGGDNIEDVKYLYAMFKMTSN